MKDMEIGEKTIEIIHRHNKGCNKAVAEGLKDLDKTIGGK